MPTSGLQALETVVGLCITLVANVSVLYVGHLVGRRFWPQARSSTRLAANATVSLACILAIFFPLALAGAFTRWAALLAAVALGLTGHAMWGSCRDIRGELGRLVGWGRVVAASRGGLLLLGVGMILLLAAFRGLTRPPLSYDSLNYHNYVAATWVQSARLVSLPFPAVSDYPFFPVNAHALVAWVMLPFHNDFLVNLVNFPLLALAAVSIYGLCRELGLGVRESSLAAALVCCSPALLAYVTTQYADVFASSLLLAGALHMVRCLREWTWPDAAAGLLACALAVGAKHSAIAPAALVCILLLLLWASRGAGGGARRALGALLLGSVLMLAFGGYRYARNLLETGNPLYPLNVRVLGVDLFPGSVAAAEAEAILGRGTWRDDVRQIARSMTYSRVDEPASITWGPKVPLLLALAALALARARRSREPWALWALALCWAAPILVFYLDPSPKTLLMRRFWHVSCCRYLGLSVGLMTATALVGVSLLASARAAAIVRTVLCGLVLLDIALMCIIPDSPDALVVAGCALPVLLAAGVLAGRAHLRWRALRLPLALLAAALAVAGAVGLQGFRDSLRHHFYATRLDLHPIPRYWAPGWAYCDRPGEKWTVALAVYSPEFGDHWFFYPLMGRRLQNRVFYVPPERPLEEATSVRGKAEPLAPDHGVWLHNLAKLAVSHVFVQLHPELPDGAPGREPVELGWLRARPDLFELLDQGEHHRVYRVLGQGVPTH